MRMLTLSNRNTKEILRDPLTLIFGLGFPLVLILLLSAIQANIPVKLFEIQHLTPGITVFGLAFMTLFSSTIIAKDRGSSLLQRLYTTPLTPLDFILGYTLPIIPIYYPLLLTFVFFFIFAGNMASHNISTEPVTYDLSTCKGLQGIDLDELCAAIGMGSARLDGTVLTLDGQTSVILR